MGINCVKTDIYAHASAFVELKPEWMDLLAQSAPRSIFQTPQWQNLWWDNFSDGLNLRILTVRWGVAGAGHRRRVGRARRHRRCEGW